KELVLTGINLSRYGADLGLRPSTAIQTVCNLDGDFRVRLGSVEPKLMDFEDFHALAGLSKLCPHFHLALQSGSDKTLQRMGRRYTTREYTEFVDYIFKNFKNPSITTDLMVGFMGETDEEFNETKSFVASLPLLKANIFEYSQREGTRAPSFEGSISPQKKKERALELKEICDKQSEEFLKTQLKTHGRVLIEGSGNGYTDNYVPVKMLTPAPVASLQEVFLKDMKGGTIFAQLKEALKEEVK
ncbi:MAG: radical SAM protein, partial [Oscillospiraceae bacterium]